MTSGFVTILSIPLFFVTAGEGVPLVYVHGNTGSSRWFSRVMEVPGFKTYAIDLPNFGRSGQMPGEVDLHRYADFVGAFLDEMEITGAVVVGHSLGGAVVQSLALRDPNRLKAMALVDSAAPDGLFTPPDRHPLIRAMKADRAFLSKALAATVPALSDQVFFESLVDDALAMAEPAWIGNAVALGKFDISSRCSEVDMPVLVLWGRKDYIVTEEMARKTAAAYRGAELDIVENVGHSLPVENPEGFVTRLVEFARRAKLN